VFSVLIASECSAMVLLRYCGIGSGGERSKRHSDATDAPILLVIGRASLSARRSNNPRRLTITA
jgi:hypothetical protein